MTTSVLIVDDDELIRLGLRAIIDAQPDLRVAGEAADGAGVPPLVARLRPDVVLMDVRMPAIDGIQATRHLIATSAEPPRVLVITTFENDEYVYEALRAGASGFLLKRARPADVVEAIRVVARGESLLFPAAIRRLATSYGGHGDGDRLSRARLTDREADVLRLMASGLSNVEIATELVVGLETVKTHVGNVLAKLGARDRSGSCGRGAGVTWTSAASAARWGRRAAYTAAAVPVGYALTRLAWLVGIPLGISEEFLRELHEDDGVWAGAGLGAFGMVGGILTLGLVQGGASGSPAGWLGWPGDGCRSSWRWCRQPWSRSRWPRRASASSPARRSWSCWPT